MRAMLRAALAGVATGARSQSGLAACALTPMTAGSNRVDRILHRVLPRGLALVPVAFEAVADKLPITPARTAPPGLAVRLVLGALTASVLAARRGESQRAAATVGAVAATAASFAGMRARAALAAKAGSDPPAALTEDVLAVGLGFAAAHLP